MRCSCWPRNLKIASTLLQPVKEKPVGALPWTLQRKRVPQLWSCERMPFSSFIPAGDAEYGSPRRPLCLVVCLLKLMDWNWCVFFTKVHTPFRVLWFYKPCLCPRSLFGHNTFNCPVSLFFINCDIISDFPHFNENFRDYCSSIL